MSDPNLLTVRRAMESMRDRHAEECGHDCPDLVDIAIALTALSFAIGDHRRWDAPSEQPRAAPFEPLAVLPEKEK